jgi:hypothetical protein
MSKIQNEVNEEELCGQFEKMSQITLKISKLKLFLKLSEFDEKKPDEFKIVNVSSFTGEFNDLILGNGGSWCRQSSWTKNKVATMKKNGTINYLWNTSDGEKEIVIKAFSGYPIKKGGNIQYIGIFGLLYKKRYRPIRNDIKKYWFQFACCACGRTTDLICDHKNDLYNDPRVLDTKTQKKEDFQSLCNQCNLLKRQVIKKTKKTKIRYGATNIPMLKVFGINFIEGDETYDSDDIDAIKGTYWYDPATFMVGIKNILKKRYYLLGIKSKKILKKDQSSSSESNGSSSNEKSSSNESSDSSSNEKSSSDESSDSE